MNVFRISFIVLLIVGFSCEDHYAELDLDSLKRQKNEAKAYFENNIKPSLGFGNANARLNTFSRPLLTEDLNWDKAWIREISFGSALAVPIIYQTELFTPISSDSVTTLTNTTYAQFYHNEQDELVSEIVNIIPDIGSRENEEFSGVIYVQDWEGNFVKGFKHQDGEVYEMRQNNNPLENGRTTTEICQGEVTDWYTCTAIVGIWDWECHYSYTEITEVCDYVYLPSGGGSGSSGSGGSDDYDPNSGLPGYSGPINNSPKTADELCGEGYYFDDETGKCVSDEYFDLSSVLTPVKPEDNINNPYDGMMAFDKNGIIYTFDAELNTWLLPELSFINESTQYEINAPISPFESSLVMTMTPIALGEPTWIGEVVLAGTTIVVGIIYIYDLYTYLENATLDEKEHCINMYNLCATRFGYKNMDCSTCLQYCNVQGYWDFANCPLND
jgi:hypothetical protein